MHGGTCTNENWYGLRVEMRVKLQAGCSLNISSVEVAWTLYIETTKSVDSIGGADMGGIVYTYFVALSPLLGCTWWLAPLQLWDI